MLHISVIVWYISFYGWIISHCLLFGYTYIYTEMRPLNNKVILFLIFFFFTLFHSAGTIWHSHQKHAVLLLPWILINTMMVVILRLWSDLIGLDFYFLMISDVKYFCVGTWAICISLEKCSFKSFAHLLVALFAATVVELQKFLLYAGY